MVQPFIGTYLIIFVLHFGARVRNDIVRRITVGSTTNYIWFGE